MNRLVLLLIVGVASVVAAAYWSNKQIWDAHAATELAIRAGKISHHSPDESVLLIEQALDLDPRNAAIWYDASGIYGLKAMHVFVRGEQHHYLWLEKAIIAAETANALSDDWFYVRDHADTLLFAYMYEYQDADLSKALSLYKSIALTGNDGVDDNLKTRVKAVERILADRKEFFDEAPVRPSDYDVADRWVSDDLQ